MSASNSRSTSSRWYVLAACITAMMAVANLQYSWTLFTTPLTESLGASLAAIQLTFSLFVFTQTWLLPINAYLIDRLGARLIVSISALLIGAGWIGAGLANSLLVLYASYAIGGIGAGAVYGATVGLAMKWFPDRRGLCVGAVVGSYGFGSALTVIPISRMIDNSGYQSTFVFWGFILGAVVLVAAQFLKIPDQGWTPENWEEKKIKIQARVQQSSRDYTPREMLRSRSFYLLYLMMTMVALGGMMLTAQLGPIGRAYGMDKHLLLGGITALNLALLLDRVLNGITRVIWGWVSDHIGRYNTMAVAFFLEALAITGLTLALSHPLWFVIMSGLTFFAWGEIYSLFPTAIADIFGSKYSTTNFGIQYTSKGLASVLAAPGAAMLWDLSHSWAPMFWVSVVGDLAAAGMALFWLKPLVKRLVGQRQVIIPSEPSAAPQAEILASE